VGTLTGLSNSSILGRAIGKIDIKEGDLLSEKRYKQQRYYRERRIRKDVLIS